MSTPLVSVIVPTYNRPGYLARALASIRAQTFGDFEIIVVNDAGEDVKQLVEMFGAYYTAHRENKGLPTARNNGIRRAQGKYIAYLDDDDVWLPEHLEKLVGLRESSSCRLVYSDSYFWMDERRFEKLLSHDYSRAELIKHNLTPICSILHDRELWEEAGKFNPLLPNHEDYELWLRMSEITDFQHLNEVTALYSKRTGSDQMSMDLAFMAAQKAKIQQVYDVNLGIKEKHMAGKIIQGKALRSFVSRVNGNNIAVSAGQITPILDWNWVTSGLVVPIPPEIPEPEKMTGGHGDAVMGRRDNKEKAVVVIKKRGKNVTKA